MYRCGDIISIDVAFSDGSASKIRPVCVFLTEQDDVVFFHMTTQGAKSSYDITLAPSTQNNLRAPTTIRLTKISRYHHALIRKKIGTADEKDKQVMKKILQQILDEMVG